MLQLNHTIKSFKKSFVKRRKRFEQKHQSLFAFIAGTALITFWYGIWEGLKTVPVLGEPIVAIVVGGLVLVICGSYAYQLLGGAVDAIKEASEDIEEIAEDLEGLSKNVEEVDRQLDYVEDKVEELQQV